MIQLLIDLKPRRCDVEVTVLVKYIDNKKKEGKIETFFMLSY